MPWGWGDFEAFKREWDRREWEWNTEKGEFWENGIGSGYYWTVSSVASPKYLMFDGRFMVMKTFKDWKKVRDFLEKHNHMPTVDWGVEEKAGDKAG